VPEHRPRPRENLLKNNSLGWFILKRIEKGSHSMNGYLPERWDSRLKTYLREELKVGRGSLLATDFRYSVEVNLEDGSFAFFRHAFYLIDQESAEVAVFTEHCGYHVFPLVGTRLELLERKRVDDVSGA
jgi:hypothetical protein